MTDKILINNVNFLTIFCKLELLKFITFQYEEFIFILPIKHLEHIVSFVIINFPFDDPVFYIL